jgi:hypothetical protein
MKSLQKHYQLHPIVLLCVGTDIRWYEYYTKRPFDTLVFLTTKLLCTKNL